jgi:hypothetical protein
MLSLKSVLEFSLLFTKCECLRDEVDDMTKASKTTLFRFLLTPAPGTCKSLYAGVVILSIIEDEAANLRGDVIFFAYSLDGLSNVLSTMWSF